MTIPKKFHLYGQAIEVKATHSMAERDRALGMSHLDRNVIRLSTTADGLPIDLRLAEETFLHEMTHMILQKMNHKLTHDEQFVDHFACLLHQALNSFEGQLDFDTYLTPEQIEDLR